MQARARTTPHRIRQPSMWGGRVAGPCAVSQRVLRCGLSCDCSMAARVSCILTGLAASSPVAVVRGPYTHKPYL